MVLDKAVFSSRDIIGRGRLRSDELINLSNALFEELDRSLYEADVPRLATDVLLLAAAPGRPSYECTENKSAGVDSGRSESEGGFFSAHGIMIRRPTKLECLVEMAQVADQSLCGTITFVDFLRAAASFVRKLYNYPRTAIVRRAESKVAFSKSTRCPDEVIAISGTRLISKICGEQLGNIFLKEPRSVEVRYAGRNINNKQVEVKC